MSNSLSLPLRGLLSIFFLQNSAFFGQKCQDRGEFFLPPSQVDEEEEEEDIWPWEIWGGGGEEEEERFRISNVDFFPDLTVKNDAVCAWWK